MLTFLGIGSAFNPELGNTSAYRKRKSSVILIDSGGTVFHKFQKQKLFDGLEQLYILITHTHPDHVGSLGEIIFYAYYMRKIKPTLFFPDEELMRSFLSCIGVSREMYILESSDKVILPDENLGEVRIEFLSVPHVETIPAYAFIMKQREGCFYYSGDTNEISSEIITRLSKGELDRVYQDTCGLDYEGNNHMSLKKLGERIPPSLRSKVYCMHLDKQINRQDIISQGFQVVELVK